MCHLSFSIFELSATAEKQETRDEAEYRSGRLGNGRGPGELEGRRDEVDYGRGTAAPGEAHGMGGATVEILQDGDGFETGLVGEIERNGLP